jgi:hypothetical protein
MVGVAFVSLLDRQGAESIVVYLDETFTDSDGNLMRRASTTGIPYTATIQVLAQSGTSSRRAEQDNEGFESEEMYRMRLPRSFPHIIGAAAEVEWLGLRWAVIGKVRRYNGSPRTHHYDYMIRRT